MVIGSVILMEKLKDSCLVRLMDWPMARPRVRLKVKPKRLDSERVKMMVRLKGWH